MKFEKTEVWGFEHAKKIDDMNYFITKNGVIFNSKGHRIKEQVSNNVIYEFLYIIIKNILFIDWWLKLLFRIQMIYHK